MRKGRELSERKRDARSEDLPPCCSLFVALALMLGAASLASAQSISKGLTNSDLVQYAGNENSVAVLLLNLTPYTIDYASSSMDDTGALTLDRNRKTKKSFMFASLGVPTRIPGLKRGSDGGYVKDLTVHPYPMVLSWDDRAGRNVDTTSVAWTVRDVCYITDPTCGLRKDTTLALWLTRQDPKPDLKSGFFTLTVDLVKLGLETAALVETGGASGLAWVNAVLATEEVAKGATEFGVENTKPDYGPRMYVSALPLPSAACKAGPCSPTCMNGIGSGCQPGFATMDLADATHDPDDAVSSQWGNSQAGDAAANLVVTTQLLRGAMPGKDAYLGTVPVVTVVVWDAALFQTAWAQYVSDWCGHNLDYCKTHTCGACQTTAGSAKLFSLLHQRRHQGQVDLLRLVRSFDPLERQTFQDTFKALGSRHPLTSKQEGFLDALAFAFQKRATSLKPTTLPKRGEAHVR